MKRIWLAIVIIFPLTIFLAGCGESKKPVAVVNGEKITKEEFYKELEEAAGADVLISLIRQRIIVQAAKEEGVYPTEEEIEKEIELQNKRNPQLRSQLAKRGITEEELKQSVAENLAGVKLITKGIEVSDKEVEDFFNRNKNAFEIVRVRWIVTLGEEAIKKAKAKLDAGATFETVAQDSSLDPYTKERGGDMGYTSIADLSGIDPKLAGVAQSLPLGKASDIIKLSRGRYAIIRVEERIPANLADYRESIARQIALDKAVQEGKPEKVLRPVFEKAKVEIKEGRFKDIWSTALSSPSL